MSFIWPINDELIAHVDSQWTAGYVAQASQCFCYHSSNFSPGLQASYLSSYRWLLFLLHFTQKLWLVVKLEILAWIKCLCSKPAIWSEFRYQSHFLKNMFIQYSSAMTNIFWRKCNCCLWYYQLALSLRIHIFWQPKGQIIWSELIQSAIWTCLKINMCIVSFSRVKSMASQKGARLFQTIFPSRCCTHLCASNRTEKRKGLTTFPPLHTHLVTLCAKLVGQLALETLKMFTPADQFQSQKVVGSMGFRHSWIR